MDLMETWPLRVTLWAHPSDPRGIPVRQSRLVPCCASAIKLAVTCAATAQCPNTLVAWGKNNEGQCNVPQGLGRVQSMAASESWSTAFARGRVTTWGRAPSGSGASWVNPPQDVTLGGGVPRLFAGGSFTAAWNPQNGRLACWGSNIYGECNVPSDLPPVKAVAAGRQRMLAIESKSGLVRAWGGNSYGEGLVPRNLGPCVSVAAGNRHSAAVRADGQLRCWGDNFRDACTLPADTTGFVHVSATNFHSLAQRGDFSIRAWGWNDDGQCNIPPGLCEVLDGGISAGTRHSAAIVLCGGGATVRCWGSNEAGACDVPAGLTDVVAVAAAFDRTMALRSNGRVVAWGNNNLGQSTVPDSADNPELITGGSEFSMAASGTAPYQVFAWGNNQYGQHNLPQPGAGQRYTQLAAGWSHVVGLLADGTMRYAGGSWSGHCGNMPAVGNIRQVAASNFYTLAVDHNNTIHAWEQQVLQSATFWNGRQARVVGAGNDTQAMVTLDGTFLCKGGWNPFTASPCEDDILGNFGDITQIAVGLTHLLVLRSDGTIYAWATLTDDPNLNIPSGTGPISQIAAGSNHSVALSAAGRVYCWGSNSNGQCNIPADIGKVKRIAAGTDHTIAIRDFGTPLADGDASEAPCPYGRGDLNADGFVDAVDLSILMSLWDFVDAEIGDLDGDRTVDGEDLAQLLSNWDPPASR